MNAKEKINDFNQDLHNLLKGNLSVQGMTDTQRWDAARKLASAQNPTIPRLYVITVATSESRLIELPDVGVAFEEPVASWVP